MKHDNALQKSLTEVFFENSEQIREERAKKEQELQNKINIIILMQRKVNEYRKCAM